MANAALERLMDNARVHLPGAIDDALKLELFNTLNEFFSASRSWMDEIRVRARPDKTVYILATDEAGTPCSLVSLVNASNSPVAATMPMPGELRLRYAPSQEETYTATVALTTVDPEDHDGYPQMPEWTLTQYYDGVLAGLLSKMFLQPAKPYSNERLSVLYGRKFRAAIATAAGEARRQHLYGGQRWRFPVFAGGSQR